MNAHDAKLRMAELMLEIADRQSRLVELAMRLGELDLLRDEELDRAHRDRDRFAEQCAADPALCQLLAGCWMIDVDGGPLCERELPALSEQLSDGEVPGFIDFVGSLTELSRRVYDLVEELGMSITDSGCGPDGWSIGVPCDEIAAERLCRALYDRFEPEIGAGTLTVRKKFWGWRFAGLETPAKAARFWAEARRVS
jgi:hypothetical protein